MKKHCKNKKLSDEYSIICIAKAPPANPARLRRAVDVGGEVSRTGAMYVGRLGKPKEGADEVWRAQAAGIGWSNKRVLVLTPYPQLTAVERLRVHAARGLIAAGIGGGHADVDGVVALE